MFNKMQKMARPTAAGILALALVLIAAHTQPVYAVPQLMTEYGDQMAWSSAEINAMGGTGTALYRGGMSNIFNPAYLVEARGTRFDASVALDQEHEDRFQPLFDNFNSFVADAAIASNRNHYWQSGFALAIQAGNEDQPVAIGLSLTDRYGFDYNFDEELRNPSGRDIGTRDLIFEERAFSVGGTLRNLSLGVGSDVTDRISIGAALHYAFGTRTETESVRDYYMDDGDNSYWTEDVQDLEGTNYTLGVRGVISERVEIGVAWESALMVQGSNSGSYVGVTDTTDSNGYRSIRYPNIFRAGVTFRPRTDPLTVFTVEVEYKPWSELEDSEQSGSGNPQNLNDVTDVRIGLEHTFYNGIPLRFGFRHFDSYADRDGSASSFSAGVGAPIGSGMLSVSMELSKITALLPHHFPYPEDVLGTTDNFHSDPYARVEDTRFRIGVGYKVEF